jgi:hypothetical protein
MGFRIKQNTACIVFCFALLFAGDVLLGARTIETLVVTDKGVPVPSAVITHFQINGGSGATSPATSSSDVSGKTSVNVADAGTWKVCAGDYAHNLLDSCLWGPEFAQDQVKSSEIAPGSTKAAATIVLHAGVKIQLQVTDPNSLLAAKDGSRSLRMGVIATNGHYYQASQVNTTGKTVNYEILVPPGMTFFLSAVPYGVAITDGNGVPLVQSKPQKFVATDGAKPLTFQVSTPAAPGKD